jgi:hypothetical protein
MNRIRRLHVFLAVFLLQAAVADVRAADEIILRTSTNPEQAWVGQRVRLNLEVLGPDGWAQIPNLPEVEVAGAYVMQTESQGVRISETIARTTYTGQRYQLSVYCQRAGILEIPPLPVTAVLKQWGTSADETPQELTTPPTSLLCKVPPGAEEIRGLISTTRLEADQSWSSTPETAAPGDAITRTVTLSAVDVSGMAFPPIQQPEIEGVGLYPGQPSVSDETDRGALDGRREESITYVFESPGEVELPDIVLSWWDIENRALRRIELRGIEVRVEGVTAAEPSTEVAESAPIEPPRKRWPLAVAAVVLAVLGLWFGPRLGLWVRNWQRERRDSEPAHFRKVQAAIRDRDPATISAVIMSWLDRLDPGPRPARLDLFLEDHGDDSCKAAAAALASSLAAGEPFHEGRALARGLAESRRHLLRSRRHQQQAATVLPKLNG